MVCRCPYGALTASQTAQRVLERVCCVSKYVNGMLLRLILILSEFPTWLMWPVVYLFGAFIKVLVISLCYNDTDRAIDPGIPERSFTEPQESNKRGQGPVGSVAAGYFFPWTWRWENGVQVRIYSLSDTTSTYA